MKQEIEMTTVWTHEGYPIEGAVVATGKGKASGKGERDSRVKARKTCNVTIAMNSGTLQPSAQMQSNATIAAKRGIKPQTAG